MPHKAKGAGCAEAAILPPSADCPDTPRMPADPNSNESQAECSNRFRAVQDLGMSEFSVQNPQDAEHDQADQHAQQSNAKQSLESADSHSAP